MVDIKIIFSRLFETTHPLKPATGVFGEKMKNHSDAISNASLSLAVKQISEMPITKVEKTIDDIAHHKGDEFVKDILAHLPPVKIAAILRQHDFSCPSIITWILTPKIIVNVLKTDPLFWMNILDIKKPDNFDRIQSNALDLMTSLLVNGKTREKQKEILQQISSHNLSLFYLYLPFIGWEIKEEQTVVFEDHDTELGTPDHLFELIRWATPYVAKQIFDFIYSTENHLVNCITDIWSEAFSHFHTDHGYTSVENIMFVPVG